MVIVEVKILTNKQTHSVKKVFILRGQFNSQSKMTVRSGIKPIENAEILHLVLLLNTPKSTEPRTQQ